MKYLTLALAFLPAVSVHAHPGHVHESSLSPFIQGVAVVALVGIAIAVTKSVIASKS